MANYSSLISAINAAIKQNGNQEITGPVLNSVLNAMVSSLGNGWQFGGVVTPSSAPGSPDQKMFYLAWTPGAYTGFGGKVLGPNELGVFTKTGSTVTLNTVNLGGGFSPSGPGTYVVTNLELLDDSAASAQIDTAIGGFDNLVAAIQSGAVVLSADTTDYQHAYKIAVAELGDTGEGLASITILDTSKLNLERYTISKSSSGGLSLELFTISFRPINNVYTVRMKGLENTSNSNEIIAAIGSWPNLFSALSDNKIIMEVPTESEPYGSLYICHIVTGTSTTGVIQLSTLDSSSGNYVLKTYTISAASAEQLSVTVESVSYVTHGELTSATLSDFKTASKTIPGAVNELKKNVDAKQSKTDAALQTEDKTVVGAINELKASNDSKQDKLKAGTGVEITSDNTINVILDTTVFKVVPSLPDSPASGDMNKIHLVPSENVGENNSYKEYLWANNKWEEIGTYVSTVDLTPYLTKEDAGKTYQTITDSSLQTQDKTVPGAINEVNAGLKEVVKPYVINLTALLAAQDSESISAAVGGIDNLNGTVQKNQVIFGTLANGTVAVGIRVLGNQTTLTYFVDSVVGLTVNEIIITNTSGTLAKTANTHAVLTENMVVNSLDSDETTLPLSAAQGKALDSKINNIDVSDDITNAINALTSDDIPELPQSKITDLSTNLAAKQDTLTAGTGIEITPENRINVTLDTTVFKVVSALPESPAAGDENKIFLVPAESTEEGNIYTEYVFVNGKWEEFGTYRSEVNLTPYLKTADAESTYQKINDSTLATNAKTVVGAINELKSSVDTGNNSYMQCLHKVYEEYGAVYNDKTGYWEYGDLKDMTEEDCFLAAFYALEQIQGDNLISFILDRYKNLSARTYFTKITPKGSQNDTILVLDSCFAESNKLEYLKLSDTPTSLFLYIKNMQNAFRNCRKLRKIEDILTIYTDKNHHIEYAFMRCSALKDVKIRLKTGSNVNLSFEDSRLLSYESIKYLVDNAGNTAAITITVHPTTYSYLTGAAQPTEEVGGTAEEWQALVTTAQGKQISFA